MKEKNNVSSDFSLQSMIATALPSYIFPAVMSFFIGLLPSENRTDGSKLQHDRFIIFDIYNIKLHYTLATKYEANFSTK